MAWSVETATDIGGRAEQQDRVIALRSRWRGEHLVTVADGMGGHQDGAAAAQAVVDTSARLFSRWRRVRKPRQFLERLCTDAHHAVHRLREDLHVPNPPGSTCVMLYLHAAEAYWLHVGDSRLYHFRAGELLSQTRDHSLVELMRQRDPSQATQYGGNVLYSCLGSDADPMPELGACAVDREDWFLLCSDGFWNMVSPEEMVREVVESQVRAPSPAVRLALLAAERGGMDGDNVTVAIARPLAAARPR